MKVNRTISIEAEVWGAAQARNPNMSRFVEDLIKATLEARPETEAEKVAREAKAAEFQTKISDARKTLALKADLFRTYAPAEIRATKDKLLTSFRADTPAARAELTAKPGFWLKVAERLGKPKEASPAPPEEKGGQ